MSWGAIPASILMDIARAEGCMTQLELDLGCPIWVFVDPKYLTSEVNGYSIVKHNGHNNGVLGTEDHPRFRDTRNWLEKNGYIQCERSYSNGDTVLKDFFFNNVLLISGESFSCAGAMGGKRFTENYNDGKPDYTLKNYKDLDVDDYVYKDVDCW